MWRRQFYGDLGHGMKIVNLFEFRPVQAAYTENHVSLPAMYEEVRRSFCELAQFEDIVQAGHVRAGLAGLWFSETGDIWDDNAGSCAAAKRALYLAVRHAQIPLDVVVEEDALNGALGEYRVLYLTDVHVGREASAAIANWVRQGGRLFATAGAGMRDELDRPNDGMQALFGVEPLERIAPPAAQVGFIKQDLPFVEPLDTVAWPEGDTVREMPAIGVVSRVKVNDAETVATFRDRSPAVTVRRAGDGTVTYCAFLPGLSYFSGAVPRRPVDRGSTDNAMSHFMPSDFNSAAADLIARPADGLQRPVVCSQPLVETTVVGSKHGVVIPLVNWGPQPVTGLCVTVAIPLPAKTASLASGRPVARSSGQGAAVFTLDLEIADALILR
jgi:hypothetical protein